MSKISNFICFSIVCVEMKVHQRKKNASELEKCLNKYIFFNYKTFSKFLDGILKVSYGILYLRLLLSRGSPAL